MCTLGRGAVGLWPLMWLRPAKLRPQLHREGLVACNGWPRPAASGRWWAAATWVVLVACCCLAVASCGWL